MSPDPNFACQGRYKSQPNCVSGVSIDIVGKHGELIAAEPGQEITRPSGRPKALGNDLQDTIPSAWPWRSLTRLKSLRSIRKKACLRPSEGDEAVATVNPLASHDGSPAPSIILATPAPGAHASDFS